MKSLDDFVGWKEGLWLERLGSLVLTLVLIGLLLFLHYEINRVDGIWDYPIWVYLMLGFLIFLIIYPYKKVSPIDYDSEGLYYIHKNVLVMEKWSNIKPIKGDEHSNRRTMKVCFHNKSLIGNHFKAVYFTPKKKLISQEDVGKILELSRGDKTTEESIKN
jgi:hypothetical protein